MKPDAHDVVELTAHLIRQRSVTPDDAGCQTVIAERLTARGFVAEHLDHEGVSNLWLTHGTGSPLVCLLGHTDVVPAGPVERWSSDPFEPTIVEGHLVGRGAADMKGSVAAFVCALEQLVKEQPDHPGTLALLLTSDEEGDAIHGVRRVAAQFSEQGRSIDYCLVGEPSSSKTLGDIVRIGRRGSLTARVTARGVQGHVAYPDAAINPIHRLLPALLELSARTWDETAAPDFPPTSLQIANFNAGTGASNVIPGSADVEFNLRYSPNWSADALIADIEACFSRHGVDVDIHWHRSGEPFYTAPGRLRRAVCSAIKEILNLVPDENTGGGTSDGRFIAPLGAQVVELGPINASIHKIDETVALADLRRLPSLYAQCVRELWRECEALTPKSR